MFEDKDKPIGLPIYLLYDLSPSKIKKFKDFIDTKKNSLGLLLLLMLGDNHPFKIHKINDTQIEEKYGHNDMESEIQIKNLVIINDEDKLVRDRLKKLKKLKKQIKT